MKVEELKLNGDTFTCIPFKALEGLRLKARLIKLLAPSLKELIGSDNLSDVMQKDLTGFNLGAAIQGLIENLDEDEFISLVRQIFSNLTCEHTDAETNTIRVFEFRNDFENSFNAVFEAKIFSIYPVILFVLKANYPDFFQILAGGTKSTQKTDTTPSPKQKGRREIKNLAK